MRAYRMRKRLGTIEAVIKAGVTGAIAGLGVSEVAAVIGSLGAIAVTLRKGNAELLIAEMTAPGAELAYISKARQTFG